MAENELQVILKSKELAEHTLRITSNCNRYPKKWRFAWELYRAVSLDGFVCREILGREIGMQQATSRLQGWDYIKSLMKPCKKCGETPTLGTPVVGKKWRVCCMNITCVNFNQYEDDNPFMAIHKWNKNE